MQGMLATQLNSHVNDGSIVQNSIIRMTKYLSNPVGAKKILIILGIDIISPGLASEKVGSPVAFEAPVAAPINANTYQMPKNNLNTSYNAPAAPPQRSFGAVSSESQAVVPISALNPYQNRFVTFLIRWTIKARVISKGDIKRFKNARGDGQLCTFNFADESVRFGTHNREI